MKTFVGIMILTILVSLAALSAANNARPPRDPCRAGMLDRCMESEDCTLNANQLRLVLERRETLKEICPVIGDTK
jgi:hypothetical protein